MTLYREALADRHHDDSVEDAVCRMLAFESHSFVRTGGDGSWLCAVDLEGYPAMIGRLNRYVVVSCDSNGMLDVWNPGKGGSLEQCSNHIDSINADLSVCADCMGLIEGNEDIQADPRWVKPEGIDHTYQVTSEDGFSWHACELCKSTLGGQRWFVEIDS